MIERYKSKKENVNFAIFKEYFPNTEIEEINLTALPEKVVKYFESKSAQFISPENYRPGNFERVFIVRYSDEKITYIAQQTKNYNENNTEKLTFFADMENDDILGVAELRFNVKCAKSDRKYFKDKPFVGWIETRGQKKVGAGTKRLYLMNAVSRMCYNLPLYSDTINSPQMKSLWDKLVEKGSAAKFKEGNNDRYVLVVGNN